MTTQVNRTPLSVVIPTLGRPILVRTVQSLLETNAASGLDIIVVGRVSDPEVGNALASLCRGHPNVRHLPVSFERGDSSEKKNAGARIARHDIVAFIDDDVVVSADWPERILEPFADASVGLVSGPSLVPDDLPRFARLAGLTLASGAAGYVARRYVSRGETPRPARWSALIGCNMAFRRPLLESLGGFRPEFWPGEEMIASWQVAQRGLKVIFHPQACLYHYPRSSPRQFVRQIYGYGATRVRLMRAGVEFEPSTLVPALLLLSSLVLSVASLFSALAAWILLFGIASYALACCFVAAVKALETRRVGDLAMLPLIPVMHVAYGVAEWAELFRPGKDLSVKPAAAAQPPR